jgi:hypothetical protein
MDEKPIITEPVKHRRRWYQFGLRTLLIAIALSGIWLGVITNRANRQRRVVELITKTEGYVAYEYDTDEDGCLDGRAVPPGPEWLRRLIGVDYLAKVSAVYSWAPEGDSAASLGDLPQLKFLAINGATVTDSTLEHIKGLTQLKTLVLLQTQVTDDGLLKLSTLTHLKDLTLFYDKITDAGLQHLNDLPSLEHLTVDGDNITVGGVEQLKLAMPTLKVDGPNLHSGIPDGE